MKWLVLAFALCAVVCLAKSEKKTVCYLAAWTIYRPDNSIFKFSNMDPNLCTHLMYAFTVISNNGEIKSIDTYLDYDDYGKKTFDEMYKLKERNPKLKNMLAMGGWKDGEPDRAPYYSLAMSTPERRTRLANSIVDFVKKYRFDGFDLDWEYPVTRNGKPEDKQNLILFLRELYQKLSKDGLELSVAVSANIYTNPLQYDIAELAKTVDFINLMTYDYHGKWDHALGHIAPLYPSPSDDAKNAGLTIDSTVKYWLQQGAPAEKLILGVPFYGQTFTMSNPNQPTLGSPSDAGLAGPYSKQAGVMSYLEMCEQFLQGGWTHVYDENQMVPHAYKGNQWIGYDDQKSLTEKVKYMKKMNLGGMMIWSIDQDDMKGLCGMGPSPLLRTLNSALHGGETPAMPVYPMSTPKPDDSQKVPYPYTTTVQPVQPAQPAAAQPSDGACTQQGYVRAKDDCSSFYYCQAQANGGFSALNKTKCPAGLMFNTATSQCDWAQNVQC